MYLGTTPLSKTAGAWDGERAMGGCTQGLNVPFELCSGPAPELAARLPAGCLHLVFNGHLRSAWAHTLESSLAVP